jgi:5-methylcytosine-specific restriction endonuclease McrA
MPLEELLVDSSRRDRGNLKRRLFGAGLKEPHCEICGMDTWRGLPISLQLHHVNGSRFDNRVENLQILCPNCHSLTDSYGGRRGSPAQADDAAAAG